MFAYQPFRSDGLALLAEQLFLSPGGLSRLNELEAGRDVDPGNWEEMVLMGKLLSSTVWCPGSLLTVCCGRGNTANLFSLNGSRAGGTVR